MPKITPTIVCLKTKKGLYLKNNFVRRDNNLYYAIMKFWCTVIFIFVVALFAEEREWLSYALLGNRLPSAVSMQVSLRDTMPRWCIILLSL